MPLRVASWALDGASYLTTKKSVMDHGLSALNGQDCAALRVVTEGSACRSNAIPGVAFNDNLSPSTNSRSFTPPSACDTAKIYEALPDTQALNRCADKLVSTYGKDNALFQCERRIERLIGEQNTDDAAIWIGIQVAVQQTADDEQPQTQDQAQSQAQSQEMTATLVRSLRTAND
ncbi:MAG: hypothetical protein NUV50_11545 [Rhodospirillales bacterium]|nr:hypothetical protein [Rhodospirillales bacterium]